LLQLWRDFRQVFPNVLPEITRALVLRTLIFYILPDIIIYIFYYLEIDIQVLKFFRTHELT
jgi:hypothetical protein